MESQAAGIKNIKKYKAFPICGKYINFARKPIFASIRERRTGPPCPELPPTDKVNKNHRMMNRYQHAVKTKVVYPITQFMHNEKASGIVLAIAVITALILANSPLAPAYHAFFHHHFGFIIDGKPCLDFSLMHWINDGLMSMFFFVVGLELKREFIGGELRHINQVILPAGAALMGMVVPSLIYLLFNHGTPAAQGWGIPMATDIAFALAIVYLLGNRVPLSAKVFLTTLAIVDDLGAVLVIALFYTSSISLPNIALGALVLTLMFTANKLGIKSVWFYAILGIGGVWTAFLMSGIHATISAVLSAFMIPADASIPEPAFISRLRNQLRRFEQADSNDVITLEQEQVEILSEVRETSRDAMPPLQRLEHGMHPLVSFVVMPVFALANAGVTFLGMDFTTLFTSYVAVGVTLGLLVGKPLGILLSTWLLTRLGVARLPGSMTWRRVAGVGFLASIGFTMSMFVTALAFSNDVHIIQAKVGIFAASIIGGCIGFILLRNAPSPGKETAPQAA